MQLLNVHIFIFYLVDLPFTYFLLITHRNPPPISLRLPNIKFCFLSSTNLSAKLALCCLFVFLPFSTTSILSDNAKMGKQHPCIDPPPLTPLPSLSSRIIPYQNSQRYNILRSGSPLARQSRFRHFPICPYRNYRLPLCAKTQYRFYLICLEVFLMILRFIKC